MVHFLFRGFHFHFHFFFVVGPPWQLQSRKVGGCQLGKTCLSRMHTYIFLAAIIIVCIIVCISRELQLFLLGVGLIHLVMGSKTKKEF